MDDQHGIEKKDGRKNLPQLYKKGSTAYKNFLAKLSPEEYEQHMIERNIKQTATKMVRNTINELWIESVLQNNTTWNTLLQRAAESVLQRAIERGDPAAFNAITDRLLGKVTQTMTINVSEKASEDDILKQIQSMALEQLSKDDNTIELHNGEEHGTNKKED